MYAAPLELDQQPAPDTPHRHDTLCLLGHRVYIHANLHTAPRHLRQRHKQTARHSGHVCHRQRVKSSSAIPLRHGHPHLQQPGDQTHARALPDAARQSCREICHTLHPHHSRWRAHICRRPGGGRCHTVCPRLYLPPQHPPFVPVGHDTLLHHRQRQPEGGRHAALPRRHC